MLHVIIHCTLTFLLYELWWVSGRRETPILYVSITKLSCKIHVYKIKTVEDEIKVIVRCAILRLCGFYDTQTSNDTKNVGLLYYVTCFSKIMC